MNTQECKYFKKLMVAREWENMRQYDFSNQRGSAPSKIASKDAVLGADSNLFENADICYVRIVQK